MEIKKFKLSVFAFLGVTVCGLRQPADRHETNLELGTSFPGQIILPILFCLMRAQAVKMQYMMQV